MRRSRYLRNIAAAMLIVVLLAAGIRLSAPWFARVLIHSDPLQHADLIVVLGSNRLARTLEAGKLYQEGWAPRILLMRPPDLESEGVLNEVGIHLPLWLDIQKSALAQMAVPTAAVISAPEVEDTTLHESELVGRYLRRAGFQRIIVVTSPYHTGRAGRLFRKAADGSFTVVMRADRYERADPDHWWRHAVDRNDVVFEWLKAIHAITFPDD